MCVCGGGGGGGAGFRVCVNVYAPRDRKTLRGIAQYVIVIMRACVPACVCACEFDNNAYK